MAISTTKSVEAKRKAPEAPINFPKWLYDPDNGDKLVRIYIDSEGGDEPVPVCINGYTVLIPVGEWVDVPEPIAAVLQQSRRIVEGSKKRNKDFAAGKEKIN